VKEDFMVGEVTSARVTSDVRKAKKEERLDKRVKKRTKDISFTYRTSI